MTIFYNHNEFTTIPQTRQRRLLNCMKMYIIPTKSEKTLIEEIFNHKSLSPAYTQVNIDFMSKLNSKYMNYRLMALDSDVHSLYDEVESLGIINELIEVEYKLIKMVQLNSGTISNISVSEFGISLAVVTNNPVSFSEEFEYMNTDEYGTASSLPFTRLGNFRGTGTLIKQTLTFDPSSLNTLIFNTTHNATILFVYPINSLSETLLLPLLVDFGIERYQANMIDKKHAILPVHPATSTNKLYIYHLQVPYKKYGFPIFDSFPSIVKNSEDIYDAENSYVPNILDNVITDVRKSLDFSKTKGQISNPDNPEQSENNNLLNDKVMEVAAKYLGNINCPDKIRESCYHTTYPNLTTSLSYKEYSPVEGVFESSPIFWLKNFKSMKIFANEQIAGPCSVQYFLKYDNYIIEVLPYNKFLYTQWDYVKNLELVGTLLFKMYLNFVPDIPAKYSFYYNGKKLSDCEVTFVKELNSGKWYVTFTIPRSDEGIVSLKYVVSPDINKIYNRTCASWTNTETSPKTQRNIVFLNNDVYYDRTDVNSFTSNSIDWKNQPIQTLTINGVSAEDITDYFDEAQSPLNLNINTYQFYLFDKNKLILNKIIEKNKIKVVYRTSTNEMTLQCVLRNNTGIASEYTPIINNIYLEFELTNNTKYYYNILGETCFSQTG